MTRAHSYRLLSLIVLTTAGLHSPLQAFARPEFCENAVKKQVERTEISNPSLAENKFNTSRDLASYNAYFKFSESKTLVDVLDGLPEQAVWMDMGAGKEFALNEGLIRNPRIEWGIAVSYKRPTYLEDHTAVASRFKSYEGDFVENMYHDGKFAQFEGKVDLITDVFGPFSYSKNLPVLLQTYFNLLKKDGHLFVNLIVEKNYVHVLGRMQPTLSPIALNSIAIEDEIFPLGLTRWLSSIPGVELERELCVFRAGAKIYETTVGFKLRKKSAEVVVPRNLVNIHYDGGAPPLRQYTWIAP